MTFNFSINKQHPAPILRVQPLISSILLFQIMCTPQYVHSDDKVIQMAVGKLQQSIKW